MLQENSEKEEEGVDILSHYFAMSVFMGDCLETRLSCVFYNLNTSLNWIIDLNKASQNLLCQVNIEFFCCYF